jgi:hypothetical protein
MSSRRSEPVVVKFGTGTQYNRLRVTCSREEYAKRHRDAMAATSSAITVG